MRTPRIYHPGPLAEGLRIVLGTDAAQHVARVLRLRAGDAVILFNGEGGEYDASIGAIEKRSVEVTLGDRREVDRESPLVITLVQGISRGERMDYTIQKAVELGVSRIVPVITERTVVNLDAARSEKRLAHWHGVLISACEQSGRTRVPELAPISKLSAHLAQERPQNGFLLDPYAERGLAGVGKPQGTISLLIGPEGGLSEAERQLCRAEGYRGVKLGPRILRTETAALAAMAAMLALWGDLGS